VGLEKTHYLPELWQSQVPFFFNYRFQNFMEMLVGVAGGQVRDIMFAQAKSIRRLSSLMRD